MEFGSAAQVISALAAAGAAAGIWRFGRAMERANADRAAQAAKDAAQAAEDRKVTQAMLAALTELIRRTSSPDPGPAD